MNDIASRRGRYDRELSRGERAGLERQALQDALQALLVEHSATQLSVSAVCQQAGVGRNTLYAHFGGVDGLLNELRQACERRLRQALLRSVEESRTPRARLLALCQAWVALLSEAPEVVPLMLDGTAGDDAISRVLGYELAVVARQAYAAGLVSRPPNEDGLAAVCGAFRAVAQRAVERRIQLENAELAALLERLTLSVLR